MTCIFQLQNDSAGIYILPNGHTHSYLTNIIKIHETYKVT